MNEIEKAVETIRQVSDLAVKTHLNISQYDLLTAIEALKEKSEREKGCEYCSHMNATSNTMSFKATGKNIRVMIDWDFNIEYCPKCGRKLVSEESHDS